MEIADIVMLCCVQSIQPLLFQLSQFLIPPPIFLQQVQALSLRQRGQRVEGARCGPGKDP